MNKDTVEFLDVFGYNSESHSSQYTGSTPMADSLLSIKYLMADNEKKVSPLYKKTYEDEKVSVYENPYVLPLAFGVSSDINKLSFREITEENEEEALTDGREYFTSDSPFERLNKLVTALTGSKEFIALYKPIDAEIIKKNCKESTSRTKFYPIDEEMDSFLSFSFSGAGDNDVYAYFPTFYYTGAEMFLNGEGIGRLFEKDNHGFVYVGRYGENEQAELSFKLDSEGIYMMRHVKFFYYLDKEVLDDVYEKLSASAYEIEVCREHYFSGTIKVSDGQNVILTTIPYDKGWQITANGEKIEGYKTLDALLAFELPSGEHKLELRYSPEIYRVGIVISACGTTLLIAIIAIEYFIKKKQKNKIS